MLKNNVLVFTDDEFASLIADGFLSGRMLLDPRLSLFLLLFISPLPERGNEGEENCPLLFRALGV